MALGVRFLSVDKPYYDGHLDRYRHLGVASPPGHCVTEPSGNRTLRLNVTAFPDMAAVWLVESASRRGRGRGRGNGEGKGTG